MVKPLTIAEQQVEQFFIVDEVLAVYFSGEKFDKVWRKNDKGQFVQAMADLTATKDDISLFSSVMARYQIKEENEFYMEDPTAAQMRKLMNTLYKRYLNNPSTNFLTIFVVAGHGM